MKKTCTLLLLLLVAKLGFAQNATFENLSSGLPTGTSFWKGNPGVPGETIFSSGSASFTNRNDTSSFGDYWSGWAYSRLKDSMSISYDTNDCAAFPGIGHNTTAIYAVAYQSFFEQYNHIRFAVASTVNGFYITNSTIAYRSMQNGDGFAKKFGGATGNDPDYFKVNITGWLNGTPKIDTIHFYLADFRDANNANDYIVKDWQWVSTVALGLVDSLTYTLSSSDTTGSYINTPAYFCMDDIVIFPNGILELSKADLISVYPNPFETEINMANASDAEITYDVVDIHGRALLHGSISSFSKQKIDTHTFANGIYFVKIYKGQQVFYQKIIK